MDFHEYAVVYHRVDDVVHVVAPVLFGRHNPGEIRVNPGRVVGRRVIRRVFLIVGWQVVQEGLDHLQAGVLIGCYEVAVAAYLAVYCRPTQLLHGHFFTGHGLYDLRSCNEHVGRSLDHKGKVRKGRGIHGSSRARAEDDGDLRHYTRILHVPEEHVSIATKGVDAFLNAGAARVVQEDKRDADLCGQIHGFHDLGRMHFSQRPADHCKVLGRHTHRPSVHQSVTRYDSLTGRLDLVHAEFLGPVSYKRVDLHKGAGIEKGCDALASGHLTCFVLPLDPPSPAALHYRFPALS